jgi:hypothetical protein
MSVEFKVAHYPNLQHVRLANKVQWSMIWIAASVFSLVLLGMVLATHC